MADAKTYSAGTIFLQVVPVFGDTMNKLKRDAKAMGKAMADDQAEAMEDGAKRGADRASQVLGTDLPKGAKKAGDKAGSEFSNEFEKQVRTAAKSAADALGEGLDPELDKLTKRLREISKTKIKPGVQSDDIYREIGKIEAAIQKIGQDRDIAIRVAGAQAIRELGRVEQAFSKIDGRTLKAKVDVDGTAKSIRDLNVLTRVMRSFSKEQRNLARTQGDAANSFRAFNGWILAGVTLLPALIPLIGALAGAIMALGPAMLGLGAGFGVMLLGFSGISDAVKGLADVEKNAAKDHEAYSRAVRNASRQVADAQRSLARARADAAQQVEDAQRSLARTEADAARARADAARNVARAQQDAARQVEAALDRQRDAEENLAEAQRDAAQAQRDLMEARREAQADLDDIADRQRQNALDIRQAQIDLFNAQVEYDAAMADGAATNLEKEQASINLGQARERLHELREEEDELAKTRKKGVDNSDQVRTAQDALTAALEQQRDAQEAVRESAEDVARARVDGAQRVADAVRDQQETERQGQQAIADAQRNLARVQVDSQQAIADAQRNLRRAQVDYRDALDETSTSVENLEDAMSKLGPAGQAFARYLYSLRGYFHRLRSVIQEGLLPGVQDAMQRVLGRYGESLIRFSGRMAETIGQMFREFGRMLTNPLWAEFFRMIDRLGPKFTRDFARATMNWASVFARLMIIAAPWAERFSEALLRLSERALAFVESEKGTKAWQSFMGYAAKVGPKVVAFFWALWGAIKNLAISLAPWGETILGMATGVLDFIAGMDPKILGPVAVGILILAFAFQVLAGGIALGSQAALLFATTTAGAFLHPAALIIGAVILIGGAFLALYTQSETFRKYIHAIMHAIGAVAKWLWEEAFKPALKAIGWAWKELWELFQYWWKAAGQPIFDVVSAVLGWLWRKIFRPYLGFIVARWRWMAKFFGMIWRDVLWPVFKVVAKIAWALWKFTFKVAFTLIGNGWKALATGMRWVYRNIIKPVFDWFMDIIGDRLVRAFRDGIDKIKNNWERIREILSAPIRFFIEGVLNNGLIRGFNKIAKFIGADKIDEIALPGWARKRNRSQPDLSGRKPGIQRAMGGVLPGYTPGRDVHDFYSPTGGLLHLSGGEAVMRPEWTRALGKGYIDYMNRLARTGGAKAVQRAMMGGMGQRAYKFGGVIPAPGSWNRHSGYPWATWAGDINVPGSGDLGNAVKAFKEGIVVLVRSLNSSYGNHIRINHPDGSQTLYAHLSGFNVRQGQKVRAGQLIGRVGDTGRSFGPHLHFEIKNGHGFTAPAGGGDSGLPGWLEAIIGKPLDWAKGLFNKAMDWVGDKVGDSPWLKLIGGLGRKLLDPMVDFMLGFLDDGDSGPGFAGDIPTNGVRRTVQAMAKRYGWASGEQWDALATIITRESSWDPNAANPRSSARGLFQKLTSVNGPVEGTVEGQTRWGLNYIREKYGNPLNALYAHNRQGWYADGGVIGEAPESGLADNGTMMYDNGGYLPPGLTTVLNLTGKPEPVFTADQWNDVRGGGGGGGFTYAPHFEGSDLTAEDVMDDFLFTYRRIAHGGKYVGARD